MDMNFTKAHHFSINGGNFGTVNGGVNNYTLTPNSQSSPARLGLDSIAAGLLSAPPSQGSGLDASATIHSVPSTPATGPANISPPSSTINASSPAPGNADGDSSSRRFSATPPTGMEEHHRLAASPSRPRPARQDFDLLTPLTDALNLRRFTPYQTPQEITAEFPGSPQSTDQVPTPPLPSQGSRRTQSNDHVPAPPFTLHLPQNAQSMDQIPPSNLPPCPTDFSAYRASSISPTGSDAGSQTTRHPPIPPYLHNSPPPFDSSPMSPRTVIVSQDPADSEDPSVIFQRLRADTKGYANPLPRSNVLEYSSSPPLSARMILPRQAEVPQVDRPEALEFAAPQSSQHWTPNVISDWTNNVHQVDSDVRPVHDYQDQSIPQYRASRRLPCPPAPQPQFPTNSFPLSQQPQQYSIHAGVYHVPPFRQPDHQSWPIFPPSMHPPHPFPPQHYPSYQNRLQYNQQQAAYHSTFNYGNEPNFPMPLMG